MGVRALNRYLLEHCSSIKKKHLSTFRGTVFAIDTSIYLYKFLGNFQDGDTRLEQGFRKMCNMFIQFGIKPIFVFDGKPPPEKHQVILDRIADKVLAETEYNQLIQKQSTSDSDPASESECERLNKLRRRFIRVTDEEIQSVKDIINEYKSNGYNIEYQEADGEADTLCAQLINTGKAFGCLSNDMDMFAYGCMHIMRELDMERSTVIYYNLKIILRELKLQLGLFKSAIILSGTDYNTTNGIPLYESFNLALQYQLYFIGNQPGAYNHLQPYSRTLMFYPWVMRETQYIKDYAKLMRVHSMFT